MTARSARSATRTAWIPFWSRSMDSMDYVWSAHSVSQQTKTIGTCGPGRARAHLRHPGQKGQVHRDKRGARGCECGVHETPAGGRADGRGGCVPWRVVTITRQQVAITRR